MKQTSNESGFHTDCAQMLENSESLAQSVSRQYGHGYVVRHSFEGLSPHTDAFTNFPSVIIE